MNAHDNKELRGLKQILDLSREQNRVEKPPNAYDRIGQHVGNISEIIEVAGATYFEAETYHTGEAGTHLYPFFITGPDREKASRLILPRGTGIAGVAYAKKISIIENNPLESPSFARDDIVRLGLPIPSAIIAVPVYCGSDAIGVLELLKYQGEFDEIDLELTKRVSDELTKILNEEKKRKIDRLTGLPNKEALDDALIRMIRLAWRRPDYVVSVAMTDLDKFKDVNDVYGHLCGDFILREYAQFVKGALSRPEDFFARYGGEEFVIVLPHTDITIAFKILDDIRERVKQMKFIYSGKHIPLGVSIGVSSLSQLKEQYLLRSRDPDQDQREIERSPLKLIEYFLENHLELGQSLDNPNLDSRVSNFIEGNRYSITIQEVKNDLVTIRDIMNSNHIRPHEIYDLDTRALITARIMLGHSDSAVYVAKKNGRNLVVVYNPEVHTKQ